MFLDSEEEGYLQDFMHPSSWETNTNTNPFGNVTPSQPDDNDPLYFYPLSQTSQTERFSQQNLQQEYEQEEEKGWEGMGNPEDSPSLDSIPPRFAEFFSKCPTYTEHEPILPPSSSSPPSPLSPLFFESFSTFIKIEKQQTLSCGGGAVTWHTWSPDSQFILASLLNGKIVLYHAKTGSLPLSFCPKESS